MLKKLAVILAMVSLVLYAISTLLITSDRTHAQDNTAPETTTTTSTTDDDYCTVCHGSSNSALTFENGTTVSLQVMPSTIHDSVHGDTAEEDALACSDCHTDYEYPHDPVTVSSARAYTIQQSLNCTSCHEEQTENLADGVHYTALIDGNERAATCVDCHGAHDVQPPNEPVWASSQACGDCHTITFNDYEQSVHGEALLTGDGNAPACTSCHGVHGIQHPTTALFRNRSPELCATCHADEELMEEYDISTHVFDSYLTDFHGTTVSLFDQQDPNVPTNKAVCYDCHGVHNITSADDTKSQVVRANLLETCQQCHPGATGDFPDSWVGHFEPTPDEYPFFFAVDIFYQILIPAVLIGFGGLVGTDIFRRIRQSFTSNREEESA